MELTRLPTPKLHTLTRQGSQEEFWSPDPHYSSLTIIPQEKETHIKQSTEKEREPRTCGRSNTKSRAPGIRKNQFLLWTFFLLQWYSELPIYQAGTCSVIYSLKKFCLRHWEDKWSKVTKPTMCGEEWLESRFPVSEASSLDLPKNHLPCRKVRPSSKKNKKSISPAKNLAKNLAKKGKKTPLFSRSSHSDERDNMQTTMHKQDGLLLLFRCV